MSSFFSFLRRNSNKNNSNNNNNKPAMTINEYLKLNNKRQRELKGNHSQGLSQIGVNIRNGSLMKNTNKSNKPTRRIGKSASNQISVDKYLSNKYLRKTNKNSIHPSLTRRQSLTRRP